MEVRRTPDEELRFVGFKRFVNFNFGQIKKIRFVVAIVRSYLFCYDVNNSTKDYTNGDNYLSALFGY